MTAPRRGVSVVVPLFNEQGSVAELLARLECSLAVFPGSRIVLVDDGSADATVEAAAEAAKSGRGPAIHLRRLSRNFGLQKAIAAGLEAAIEMRPPAEVVAVMDGDLQDRPEHLPDLIGALASCDVAYAVRSKRRESAAFRAAARIFYGAMSRWSRVPIPADAGNFCAMRPVAAAAIRSNLDENLFFPGLPPGWDFGSGAFRSNAMRDRTGTRAWGFAASCASRSAPSSATRRCRCRRCSCSPRSPCR